ncbi:aminopeptidase, partial [Verrucomicrobia bacterium]|nr:aminopeptidase [Verrucomicrobiota bacterium]
QLKKSVFESLRHRFDVAKLTHPSLNVYDGWMSRPLNNARLTSIDTYYQWVPMFEALQQQYDGDWEGFFNAVEQLDNDPPSEDS